MKARLVLSCPVPAVMRRGLCSDWFRNVMASLGTAVGSSLGMHGQALSSRGVAVVPYQVTFWRVESWLGSLVRSGRDVVNDVLASMVPAVESCHIASVSVRARRVPLRQSWRGESGQGKSRSGPAVMVRRVEPWEVTSGPVVVVQVG